MKNLRTHMWLCFTLGIFLLLSLVITYFVMNEIGESSTDLYLAPELIRIGIINMGTYMIYFLIVLFRAIKYTPSKA